MLQRKPGCHFFDAPLSGRKPTPSTFFMREKKYFWGGMIFTRKKHE